MPEQAVVAVAIAAEGVGLQAYRLVADEVFGKLTGGTAEALYRLAGVFGLRRVDAYHADTFAGTVHIHHDGIAVGELGNPVKAGANRA